MQTTRRARLTDQVVRVVFFICALLLVVVIISVIVFMASKAFLVFGQGATFKGFFLGTFWDPTGAGDPTGNGNPTYGAGGLILGSVITTVISIIIVAPLAIGTAVFFTEAAPSWLVRFMQPLIEIFTGIPSVVVGFLGLLVIVPLLQKLSSPLTGNLPTGGFGWGAAIVVLVIMVLPTTLSISIDALRAVPGSVREASLALGSTRWQMMSRAVLPAASAALGTAVVLGFTRAIGETLAVALVLGGSQVPKNIFTIQAFFQPNVNITALIAQDFGETSGASQNAYWTLAFVLLAITFIFVCISRYLASRSVYQ
ncbi:MAG TPA: phosphate ABC transporter permease subunit PstC [Ktedonobacteraceae bacterium]|nr:phosphate ABC transporter permease subunit PstC [Ktedonobacteraceae bacterium]